MTPTNPNEDIPTRTGRTRPPNTPPKEALNKLAATVSSEDLMTANGKTER